MNMVSIIIPIYNSEAYLSACLDSVLAQTYRNTEIILVEDGSSDSSPKICDLYARKDSRINIVSGPHGGPGAARNRGISTAIGKYIIFVDSDDVCESELIETLVANIPDEHHSMAICGIRLTDENGIPTDEYQENYRVLSSRDYVSDILSVWKASPLCGGVYSKLYRREILQDNQVLFEEDTTYAEDFCFNLKYLQYVGKIVILPDLLYRYRYGRKGSLTEKNLLESEFSSLWERRLVVMNQYQILFANYSLEEARMAEIAAFYALQKTDMIELSARRTKNYSTFKSNMNTLRNNQSAFSKIPIDQLPGVPMKDLSALGMLEKNRIRTLYLYEKARTILRRIRGRERWGA